MCAPTSPTTIPVSYPPPEVVSEDNVDMHLDTFADFDELEFEYSTDRSDVLWLFRGSCVTYFPSVASYRFKCHIVFSFEYLVI